MSRPGRRTGPLQMASDPDRAGHGPAPAGREVERRFSLQAMVAAYQVYDRLAMPRAQASQPGQQDP
jgi:hypothetical protein